MLLHRHFEQDGEWLNNMTTLSDVTPTKKPTEEGTDMPLHVTPPAEKIAREQQKMEPEMVQRRGRPRRG